VRYLKGAAALLLFAAACTGGRHQERVVLPGPTRTTAGPVAEAITAVRAQHVVDIPVETLGLTALRSLETLPPRRAVRVVEAGYGATIVLDESRSPGARLSVAWPPSPSPADMIGAVQQAADFVRTRLGTSAEDVNTAMLRGLMALDDDGAYLEPARYAALRDPARAGIGLDVTLRDRALTVVAPIEGSPAERAGLRPADRILRIDGVSTERMTAVDAAELFWGGPGSPAVLTVARREWAQPRDISVARQPIRARSVDAKVVGPGVGYMQIRRLQESTAGEVQTGLDTLRTAGAKALVLDLRANSGGPLTAAVAVAELFLPGGRLVTYTESRVPQQRLQLAARARRPTVQVPLAVLVDEGTAAGAEIVAGALREWQRATLVGTATQGQASLQTLIPLSNGGALRLTTARWFTPTGHSVDRQGLTPDVEVARGPDEDRSVSDPGRDPQLRRATEVVRAQLRARPTSSRPAAIIPMPAMRPIRSPAGTIFSTRTVTAMAATQSRFMTPATKSSAMSAQQQPRQ
jgi:carboxyl-terminal processing protease